MLEKNFSFFFSHLMNENLYENEEGESEMHFDMIVWVLMHTACIQRCMK